MRAAAKVAVLVIAILFAAGLAAPTGADACASWDAACKAKEAAKKAEKKAKEAKEKAEKEAKKRAEQAAAAKKKAEQEAAKAAAEAKKKAEEAAKAAGEFVLKLGAILKCEATVNAIKSGQKIPGIEQFGSAMKSAAGAMAGRYQDKKAKDALMDSLKKYTEHYKHLFPELKRVAATMQKNARQVRSIFFDPKIMCGESIAKKSQRLAALGLRPNFQQRKAGLLDGLFAGEAHAAPRFYMSYQFAVGAGAGPAGTQAALTLATDYAGHGGTFATTGWQTVFGASGGANMSVHFYPAVDLGNFTGWGWELSVTGGPPTKVVSGGLEFIFDNKFRFQGMGPTVGVGLGALPVDVAVTNSHSWKLTGW